MSNTPEIYPRITPKRYSDMTLGEQIDLELLLDLGKAHKLDRSHYHGGDCQGAMHVVTTDIGCFTSECGVCGLRVTSTKSNVKVER